MSPPDDDKRRRQAACDDNLHVRIAVLEATIAHLREARDLQAKEYERRLQDLNHAHTQAEEKYREYLPRATYEKSEGERREWQRETDKKLDTASGKSAAYISVAALLLALVTLGVTTLKDWPW